MKWTPQQDAALRAVAQWLRDPKQPVFRLFGYAGTGKTTLAKHFAAGIDGGVAFAAFTGKAALVMRQSGCEGATTIHNLIYTFLGQDKEGKLQFARANGSRAAAAELIIIDECSMVDAAMGCDLLSFGVPVLALGDPAQLPPMDGGGFFTDAQPDVMLTDIRRQARDNPIIDLATTVREGGQQSVVDGIHPKTGLPYGWCIYGTPWNVRRDELPELTSGKAEDFLADAQKALAALGWGIWTAEQSNPADEEQEQSQWQKLNSAALAKLDLWVPSLFPDAKPYHGGYRVTSEMLGRDLEEDLSIVPEGIVDFGVADMGDPREGCRTSIDIVMEYGKKDFKTAVGWLQERLGISPAPPSAVVSLNRDYAFVLAGDQSMVMKFESSNKFRLLHVGAFKQWFSNVRIPVGDKIMPLGDYWLKHQQRRQYEGIEFSPRGTTAGYYNLWQGFAVQPRAGDCSKFLAHLKDNIAQGNNELFLWVVCWFAQIFQKPAEKSDTSLVLRGKMGVGKTKVGQIIGRLLGEHYTLIANSRYITGQFNSHMAALLLLHADEAFWAGDKSAEGILKDLISGDKHFIEFKRVNPISVANYLRLFVTGNSNWLVPAGFEERRFAVLDVGEEHMQDHPYFAAIDEEMDNGGREALLHYLLTFDLGQVNLRAIPKTAALLEQKIKSANPEQSWWLDTLQRGELPWGINEPNTCPKNRLFLRYITHAQQQGVPRRAIETTIGSFLTKHVGSDLIGDKKKNYRSYAGGQKVQRRGPVYVFPSLAECRRRFADELQQEIAWDGDDEWQHEDEDVRDEKDDFPAE